MRKSALLAAATAAFFIAPIAGAQEVEPQEPVATEEPAPAPSEEPAPAPADEPAPAPADEPAPEAA